MSTPQAQTFQPSIAKQLPVQRRALLRLATCIDYEINNTVDMIKITRDGLPPYVVSTLSEQGFDKSNIGWIIPPRTLAHRKEKNQNLTSEETGRLLRALKIQSMAVEVFGVKNKANHWLAKPLKALGGISGYEAMQTEAGAQLIEELLAQLDAGYFA